MNITLAIDDKIMAQLEREAARQQRTTSALVDDALRAYLALSPRSPTLSPLPSYKCGELLVDIANKDELYRALDGI